MVISAWCQLTKKRKPYGTPSANRGGNRTRNQPTGDVAVLIASITISRVEDSRDEVSPCDAQFVCDNEAAKYDLPADTSNKEDDTQ